MDEIKLKELMCDIGKRVYDKNMIAANDGNFSIKLDERTYLCTPTGVSKGFMTPEMICKVDQKGDPLETHGEWRPSTEMKMHMRIYQMRTDVKAVLHAHPQFATSYAIAGIPLNGNIMPEEVIFLGDIPTAKYGLPGTEEIPDAIEPYIMNHNAVLLENHGALTWGNSLLNAYFLMEGLEFYASLSYKARMLGGAKELPEHEVQRLIAVREKYNKIREKSEDLS